MSYTPSAREFAERLDLEKRYAEALKHGSLGQAILDGLTLSGIEAEPGCLVQRQVMNEVALAVIRAIKVSSGPLDLLERLGLDVVGE